MKYFRVGVSVFQLPNKKIPTGSVVHNVTEMWKIALLLPVYPFVFNVLMLKQNYGMVSQCNAI